MECIHCYSVFENEEDLLECLTEYLENTRTLIYIYIRSSHDVDKGRKKLRGNL